MKTTRKEALISGDLYYETGIPCLHGHLSKRSTRDGYCYQCRLDKQNKQRMMLRRGFEGASKGSL